MTETPLYSIVIPTRDRHDVLASCLQTVVKQTVGNFEAIVMDNFSGPETREVVVALNDERVRYQRAPERLSMSENWEMGLESAKGDYVLFLGDDDGLLPDCAEIATSIHSKYPGMALCWQTSLWYWPDVLPEKMQGLFKANLSPRLEKRNSREWLGKVLEFETGYSELPGIYSSFVPRSIIDAVKNRDGRYFASPIPDVWSGVVNCFDHESYLMLQRPLALRAVSHHSTGHSQLYHNSCHRAAAQFKTENHGRWSQKLDERLVGGPIFEADMLIADTLVKAQDHAPDDFSPVPLSFTAFANWLAKGPMMRYLDVYDSAVEVIQELARRNRIPEDALDIRSWDYLQDLETRFSGTIFRKRNGHQELQMNTARHLVKNVDEACAYAASLLPTSSQLKDECLDET